MVKKRHETSIRYLSQSLALEEKANPVVLHVLIVFFVSVLILFIIWASYMEIDEVSLAPGKIIPVEDIYKVQHLDGGMIKNTFVKDGQFVKKGEALLELDGERLIAQRKLNISKLKEFERKHGYIQEQVIIRSKLYEKGLNSKMSFLSLKAQESDLQGKISETEEIIETLDKQILSLMVKAPADGFVYGFDNKSQQSIIGASEIIMHIIPKDRKLLAEIQISASDIGHIKEKQPVTLKFNTYDFGKYGGCVEKIKAISPMTTLDPVSGRPYYKGLVELSSDHIGNTDKYMIIPGMTLVAEIKTGKKTIMEYLLKPVFISAKSAFREK